VKDVQVDTIWAMISTVNNSTISSIVGVIVRAMISTVESEQSFVPLPQLLVVDHMSAVSQTMISMPLISFPERVQKDDKVIEHFPFGNMVICLPKF
jgi:hypothetical protein